MRKNNKKKAVIALVLIIGIFGIFMLNNQNIQNNNFNSKLYYGAPSILVVSNLGQQSIVVSSNQGDVNNTPINKYYNLNTQLPPSNSTNFKFSILINTVPNTQNALNNITVLLDGQKINGEIVRNSTTGILYWDDSNLNGACTNLQYNCYGVGYHTIGVKAGSYTTTFTFRIG